MSFCIELFCVVTLQYQMLVRIAIAYFIIEKKKAAPQPLQAIAQRFCSIPGCGDARKAESRGFVGGSKDSHRFQVGIGAVNGDICHRSPK